MLDHLITIFCLASAASCAAGETSAPQRDTGPWDVAALQSSTPHIQHGQAMGLVSELYYEGEPYQGKKTRVFAYLATPEDAQNSDQKFPAIVLVHGGGGKAYEEWADLWAQRGYIALAMDLAGDGPNDKPLPDGGPGQSGLEKFGAIRDGIENAWPYHAVANVIRSVNVLRDLPQVDPQRIGITGISWGGFITCIVAGLDDRLQVAVPVYGCGYIHENSPWQGEFDALGPALTATWAENFDPCNYLHQAHLPMLFVNGSNDAAYPLDIHRKSFELVPGTKTLTIHLNMPHGHSDGWAPLEIARFIDAILKPDEPTTKALPELSSPTTEDSRITVSFKSMTPIVRAEFHFTTDDGPWVQRHWQTQAMTITDHHAFTEIPNARPMIYFITITDELGGAVSTPYESLP